ncbi:unnamed protein product, partial [Staurois parvus]
MLRVVMGAKESKAADSESLYAVVARSGHDSGRILSYRRSAAEWRG